MLINQRRMNDSLASSKQIATAEATRKFPNSCQQTVLPISNRYEVQQVHWRTLPNMGEGGGGVNPSNMKLTSSYVKTTKRVKNE